MSQSNVPGPTLSFADEIARIAAPAVPPEIPRMRFLEMWEQFAEGLRRTAIGADVRLSEDGTRYHLVLCPPHRPAWRTLMLTFQLTPTSVLIFQKETTTLRSPEELASWLRSFAGGAEFQNTLQALREQAEEPVEARLVLQGAPDLLVEISPDGQRQLATATTEVLSIILDLDAGDPLPDQGTIRALSSAGVDWRVDRDEVRGRTVELQLRKPR